MDRISALRNIEDALAAFERGEADLESTERHVVAVLRTYATEFETTDEGATDAGSLEAYRAAGETRVDGLVVVAVSPEAARERVADLVEGDPEFDVERLG